MALKLNVFLANMGLTTTRDMEASHGTAHHAFCGDLRSNLTTGRNAEDGRCERSC